MSILIGNPYVDKNCNKKTITSTIVKKRILNDLKKILNNLGTVSYTHLTLPTKRIV